MFHVVLTFGMLISLALSKKLNKWQEAFVPTLFFALFNLYYHFLCYSKDRWLWIIQKPIVNYFITETVYCFIIFPCWAILFIGFFPQRKPFIYLLKWSIVSVVIEYIATKMGYFNYSNGWNIAWTFFFYITTYPILRLSQVRPLQAVIFSFFLIVFYLWVFDYFPILFQGDNLTK
ncbi:MULTISPECIES: CBO0543 family protein [Sutcliffiella]|uniref:Uncharacterized protein n=1 Tax=Sutcliffiella cohnii TaxID=33932 RepID=A0A223KNR0_9BACI|nr:MULTISPECIES: CBO0543 family protein [Sutcliffiella]AST91111.1 hypothetical protein BC6307_07380 [Sutcliffiella cohnii]WBL16909.1 hypothetical protein O1A01_09860 [Sutcliffiella sp. NC1]